MLYYFIFTGYNIFTALHIKCNYKVFVYLGAVMLRKYKPVVGTGYKQHESGKIQLAIQDLQNGLSLRKTAKKYGIHYIVLYRHWKKGYVMKKSCGQTSLSADEETLFVH